jgi:hypothetical protein
MEAAVGPISDPRHKAVLDRIVVDVVDVAIEVVIVADQTLPIAPLSDAFLALGNLAG